MASPSKTNSESVAVIIPMFNEEAGAGECIERVLRVIPTLNWPARLIVVDDGSRDATPQILQKLAKQQPQQVKVVTHQHNQGYGAGVKTGIRTAQKLKLTWCLFMDSDLTNPPEDIPRFIRTASSHMVDGVKASRYMRGGKMTGVPAHRRYISVWGNWFGRICYRMGLHDYSNGFRMVRTELLSRIPYRENGFAIILEEMYYLKKMRARVVEISNVLTSRTGTLTTFRYNLTTFWTYCKYALKAAIIPSPAKNENP